jgi:hypothetical protein
MERLRRKRALKTRCGDWLRLVVTHKAAPAVGFLLIQLLGALAVLYGVAEWSIPIALIIGGVAAIAAIELRPSTKPQQRSEEDERIRKVIDTAVSAGKNPFTDKSIPMSEKWIRYVELFRLK